VGLTEKTADIQDKDYYEALPRLPRSLVGVNVSDMHAKYIKQRSRMPLLGVCIDATPEIFKQCLKSCDETKATEFNHWKQKVNEIF